MTTHLATGLRIFVVWSIGLVTILQAAGGAWSLTGSMGSARWEHSSTLLSDGRVLITGGRSASDALLSTAEIYDPALATWSPTAPMSVARTNHAAIRLADGRVVVTGGFTRTENGMMVVVATTEIYDPATAAWSSVASMASPRTAHTSTVLDNGTVLVTGGYTGSDHATTAEIFDPALGSWSTTGSMNVGRGNHTATLLDDGRVLVNSGWRMSPFGVLTSAETYDPTTGTWTSTGSLSAERINATATLLPDGSVLVIGGYTNVGGYGVTTSSAETYDPASGAWTQRASMNVSRGGHVAALLLEGRAVLVAGGFASDHNGSITHKTTELYHVASHSWSAGPLNIEGREYPAASLLLDGRMLISGGIYGSGVHSTAELHTPDSDSTPPVVTCDGSDGLWHNGDVSVTCTASDPESGLANSPDANVSLTTSVPTGVETANGATNSYQVCNAAGLCTIAGPVIGNKVDKKSPTINLTSPVANATYQLNASANAIYGCSDDGSGVASCQGPAATGTPIDTSSIGTKTFAVASTDAVGNSANFSVTYNVVQGGGGGQNAADLSIALSAPAKVAPGGTLTYSITVANGGKASATAVVISDVLPPGTVFAAATTTQGTVTAPPVGNNGTITVSVGNLANGATAAISIVVTATAPTGTDLSNTATVSAATQDVNSNNNAATRKTTVSKK